MSWLLAIIGIVSAAVMLTGPIWWPWIDESEWFTSIFRDSGGPGVE